LKRLCRNEKRNKRETDSWGEKGNNMGQYMGVEVGDMWYDTAARIHQDRVAVKLYDKNGAFLHSVVTPTEYYPLNGTPQVFNYANTIPVKDGEVLAAFDEEKYRVGFCYDNTTRLVAALTERGYDVKPYVGWMFVSQFQAPVHHCWAVLNGQSLIDFADDITVMLAGENAANFRQGGSLKEARKSIVDFQKAAQEQKNSVRCYPVGQATPLLFYIGSVCDPNDGRRVYNALMRKYPNHECERNCDADGYNETQKMMKQNGLMG